MTTTSKGKVFLIGAGPGDPQLLTLKAVKALGASDVVLYDYLVNPDILRHARRDAAQIFSGKRAGHPAIKQEEINRILIEQARAGRLVARLKGGDPFVFGRGGEEAEALAEQNIEWEVIPGVSSGVAAAAYAGIPLTHRQHASSVAFLTGHERPEKSQVFGWRNAAQVADTLVVFMSGRSIARISYELIKAGRHPQTPIAIIRWATYAKQEVYEGTLADIAHREDLSIPSPAIAVIGDVVSLRKRLRWFDKGERVRLLKNLSTDSQHLAEIA